VLHRTKLLTDREDGFVPKDAIPFRTLLPLYETISYVLGVNVLYSKKVLEIHDRLIDRFGSELNVTMNVPQEELAKVCEPKIAEAIIKVREGKIKYHAGYDGVYGRPIFEGEPEKRFIEQKSIGDFK
jgi:PHP family Zn ribbon phosphoesterase